jgi:hypothetical protein
MKYLLPLCLPFLLVACSVRPDYSVVYKTDIPGAGVRVIYDQRMPDFMGGEENVYVELGDGRRVQIDLNGRFSDHLHVDISEGADWYRFYVKDRYSLVGHTEYRDVTGDGELDRVWKSANEDPAHARLHPYAVITYLQREEGKAFQSNRDFGFKTSAARDYFGSKVELESHQSLSGKKVTWKPMKRE